MQSVVPAYRLYTALGRLRYGLRAMPYNAHRIAARRSVSRGRSASRGRAIVPFGTGSRSKSRGKSGVRIAKRKRVASRSRAAAPSSGKFNSGYSMVNMKARNTAKRRRVPVKRVSKRDLFAALAARVSMNLKAINEIETQRGRICLPNHRHTNSGTSLVTHLLPFHLYHLDNTCLTGTTSINIGKQFTTTNVGTLPGLTTSMYRKNEPDGEVVSDTYSFDNDITGASFWTDDQVPTDVLLKRKWYQKKVDIDLVMYGQSNADTLFRVDVVQFDPRYATWVRGTSGGVVPSNEEMNQFVHSMIAPYTQNPIYKPRRVGNVMKIVKSYKYKIPEQSADFDRVQSVKTKISIPFNRVINRYWKKGASDPAVVIDNEAAAQMNSELEDNFSTFEADAGYLNPKAMFFLLIRSSNTDVSTSLSTSDVPSARNITPGQDPTYDIQIRTQYLVDT